MKPTTKQMKIAASLWKRRFNYPRAKRKKAKHIKGLLLPAPPSECMKRENEIANYPLLWMRDEKQSSAARSDFVHVLTNQSILPSSPISAAGRVLLAPLLLNTNTFQRCARP
jgi:hypothetical protein